MFSVFRTLFVWGMVACFIGLLQSFLVRLIGYQATMTFFFGAKAAAVTQGFAWFSDAGGIFRIPGTFTFATQYSSFLYLLLSVATIEANADPEPRFRRYGTVAMFIVAFALLLSGSRATGLTVSAFFAGYFLFGLMRSGAVTLAPVAVIAAWAMLQIIGFDPGALFDRRPARRILFAHVRLSIDRGRPEVWPVWRGDWGVDERRALRGRGCVGFGRQRNTGI